MRFTDQIEQTGVARWGAKMNLTAHPEQPEEVAFHIVDSLMPVILATEQASILAGAFALGRTVLDLGSGVGFPGLVLAAAAPAQFTLVESRRKRASFLQVAAAEMGLKNVTVESGRAEQIELANQYDLVTARAFGDAATFLELAKQALKPDGLQRTNFLLAITKPAMFSLSVVLITPPWRC